MPSKDGVMVPVTIIRNIKSLASMDDKPKEPIPCEIEAYGGYGMVKLPTVTHARLIWAKHFRGIFVFVHIRGGGEKGLLWHRDGHG